MKKLILLSLVMTLMISCNQKKNETEMYETESDSATTEKTTTTMENTKTVDENSKLYACPMHPEVQGNLNENCPKCGMKLTEPVPSKNN